MTCLCTYVSLQENETPLHHAARKGHIQIVMLLIHFGADVNAVDVVCMYMTVLHSNVSNKT